MDGRGQAPWRLHRGPVEAGLGGGDTHSLQALPAGSKALHRQGVEHLVRQYDTPPGFCWRRIHPCNPGQVGRGQLLQGFLLHLPQVGAALQDAIAVRSGSAR